MNLRTLFLRPRKSRHPAAIARREESERARQAAQAKRREEMARAREVAARLDRLATPMRPREDIAAEVRAEREASKIFPARGGAETGGMGLQRFLRPVGSWGESPNPVASDGDNHAGLIPFRRTSSGGIWL